MADGPGPLQERRPIPAAFLEVVECRWDTLREKRTQRAVMSRCDSCGLMVKGGPAACPVKAMRESAW